MWYRRLIAHHLNRALAGALVAAALLVLTACRTTPPPAADLVSATVTGIEAATDEQVPPTVETGLPSGDQVDGKLQVWILDVAQGNGILVVFPDKRTMLVDMGTCWRNGYTTEGMVKRLEGAMPGSTKTIDWLVLTHADSDHYNLLPSVLETYTVTDVIVPGHVDGKAAESLATLAEEEREPRGDWERFSVWYEAKSKAGQVRVIGCGDRAQPPLELYTTGQCTVSAVAADVPPGDDDTATNAGSLVLLVSSGTWDALLSGDATKATEAEMMYAIPTGAVDTELLVVGHHGSAGSTSPQWVQRLQPNIAVISAEYGPGGKNKHNHPTDEALAALIPVTPDCLLSHNIRKYVVKEIDGKKRRVAEDWSTSESIFCTATSGTVLVTAGAGAGTVYVEK